MINSSDLKQADKNDDESDLNRRNKKTKPSSHRLEACRMEEKQHMTKQTCYKRSLQHMSTKTGEMKQGSI